MGVQDDMTKWRTIFCYDPTYLHATTYPFDGAEHTVVQPDETKLLCTTTPDADVSQPVCEGSGMRGIWPAPNSTRVQGNGIQTGSGATVFYTVPANKKLYIHNAQLTMYTTADANVYGRMMVQDDSDVAQYRIMQLYQILIGSTSLSESYSPALEALAGWDVYMYATNAEVNVRGLIHGWLEDV